MSSSALVFAAAALLAGGTACPQAQHGHRLAQALVYDGPLSEQADLMPDRSWRRGGRNYSRWSVRYVYASGRSVYLSCSYGGEPLAMRVARPVTQCVYSQDRHGKTALSCR